MGFYIFGYYLRRRASLPSLLVDVNRYATEETHHTKIPLREKTPVADVCPARTKDHVQTAEIPRTIRTLYVQHRRLQDAESHGGQERVARRGTAEEEKRRDEGGRGNRMKAS